ncbi:sensor histidine kinase [Acetobacterium wieringae]|uniref:sensor histidine kinase n=1 Tax=Acetobacterium wieringae TaxID=52694 RepID=UPI002B1E90EE|nr:sensor histidine kinase [Acetobacterium wieringae]MEA4807128.1 sensor histidine kinase [Acetobacterium wieringae]
MNKLIDKVIVFGFCLALYLTTVDNVLLIAPVLVAVIFAAASSYLTEGPVTVGLFGGYLLICFFEPVYLLFVPLIGYDSLISRYKWLWTLALLPAATGFTALSGTAVVLIPIFMLVAYFLKMRSLSLEKLRHDYKALRDTTRETALQLEKKNQMLLEKQDYELNLATLTERNRIARDIHDNVGHMLSRSILQTGALLAISEEAKTREGLIQIKETLSEAMDSIRNSVHDLHDESLDLQLELQKLIKNFEFCPVKFDYDVESPLDKEVKYCFIAVVKEAFSNTIRHSQANEVELVVREHPGLIQLVVQDNGSGSGNLNGDGIGLKNIGDRVAALNGNVHITTERGFRIFISVPKNDE